MCGEVGGGGVGFALSSVVRQPLVFVESKNLKSSITGYRPESHYWDRHVSVKTRSNPPYSVRVVVHTSDRVRDMARSRTDALEYKRIILTLAVDRERTLHFTTLGIGILILYGLITSR